MAPIFQMPRSLRKVFADVPAATSVEPAGQVPPAAKQLETAEDTEGLRDAGQQGPGASGSLAAVPKVTKEEGKAIHNAEAVPGEGEGKVESPVLCTQPDPPAQGQLTGFPKVERQEEPSCFLLSEADSPPSTGRFGALSAAVASQKRREASGLLDNERLSQAALEVTRIAESMPGLPAEPTTTRRRRGQHSLEMTRLLRDERKKHRDCRLLHPTLKSSQSTSLVQALKQEAEDQTLATVPAERAPLAETIVHNAMAQKQDSDSERAAKRRRLNFRPPLMKVGADENAQPTDSRSQACEEASTRGKTGPGLQQQIRPGTTDLLAAQDPLRNSGAQNLATLQTRVTPAQEPLLHPAKPSTARQAGSGGLVHQQSVTPAPGVAVRGSAGHALTLPGGMGAQFCSVDQASSLFQTGRGASVTLSASSLAKAQRLLGDDASAPSLAGHRGKQQNAMGARADGLRSARPAAPCLLQAGKGGAAQQGGTNARGGRHWGSMQQPAVNAAQKLLPSPDRQAPSIGVNILPSWKQRPPVPEALKRAMQPLRAVARGQAGLSSLDPLVQAQLWVSNHVIDETGKIGGSRGPQAVRPSLLADPQLLKGGDAIEEAPQSIQGQKGQEQQGQGRISREHTGGTGFSSKPPVRTVLPGGRISLGLFQTARGGALSVSAQAEAQGRKVLDTAGGRQFKPAISVKPSVLRNVEGKGDHTATALGSLKATHWGGITAGQRGAQPSLDKAPFAEAQCAQDTLDKGTGTRTDGSLKESTATENSHEEGTAAEGSGGSGSFGRGFAADGSGQCNRDRVPAAEGGVSEGSLDAIHVSEAVGAPSARARGAATGDTNAQGGSDLGGNGMQASLGKIPEAQVRGAQGRAVSGTATGCSVVEDSLTKVLDAETRSAPGMSDQRSAPVQSERLGGLAQGVGNEREGPSARAPSGKLLARWRFSSNLHPPAPGVPTPASSDESGVILGVPDGPFSGADSGVQQAKVGAGSASGDTTVVQKASAVADELGSEQAGVGAGSGCGDESEIQKTMVASGHVEGGQAVVGDGRASEERTEVWEARAASLQLKGARGADSTPQDPPAHSVFASTEAAVRRTAPTSKPSSLFQTASKKPVHISAESLKRAAALVGMEEVGEKDPTASAKLSAGLQQGAPGSTRDPGGTNLRQAEGPRGAPGSLSTEAAVCRSAPGRNTSSLFQTASRKPVHISADGLKRAAALVGDEGAGEGDHAAIPAYKAAKPLGVPLAPDATEAAGGEVGDMRAPSATLSSGRLASLFQTASRKPVSISEEGMRRAAGLFREMAASDAAGGRPGLSRAQQSSLFQTASRKPVSISEESMRRAAGIFHDIASLEAAGNDAAMPPPAGREMQDAGRGVSSTAVTMREPHGALGPAGGGIGQAGGGSLLQTASCKPVSISAGSMERAAGLLGLDTHTPDVAARGATAPSSGNSTGGLFQTASLKQVHVSESALQKAAGLLDPTKEAMTGGAASTAGLFQTASMKQVHISESALHTAAGLLGPLDPPGPTGDADAGSDDFSISRKWLSSFQRGQTRGKTSTGGPSAFVSPMLKSADDSGPSTGPPTVPLALPHSALVNPAASGPYQDLVGLAQGSIPSIFSPALVPVTPSMSGKYQLLAPRSDTSSCAPHTGPGTGTGDMGAGAHTGMLQGPKQGGQLHTPVAAPPLQGKGKKSGTAFKPVRSRKMQRKTLRRTAEGIPPYPLHWPSDDTDTVAGAGAGAAAEGAGSKAERQAKQPSVTLHNLYQDENGVKIPRIPLASFFGYPPGMDGSVQRLTPEVRAMTSASAVNFRFPVSVTIAGTKPKPSDFQAAKLPDETGAARNHVSDCGTTAVATRGTSWDAEQVERAVPGKSAHCLPDSTSCTLVALKSRAGEEECQTVPGPAEGVAHRSETAIAVTKSGAGEEDCVAGAVPRIEGQSQCQERAVTGGQSHCQGRDETGGSPAAVDDDELCIQETQRSAGASPRVPCDGPSVTAQEPNQARLTAAPTEALPSTAEALPDGAEALPCAAEALDISVDGAPSAAQALPCAEGELPCAIEAPPCVTGALTIAAEAPPSAADWAPDELPAAHQGSTVCAGLAVGAAETTDHLEVHQSTLCAELAVRTAQRGDLDLVGEGTGPGWEEFRDALLEQGADPKLATRDWVSNHYRWVVWKYACYERSYPTQWAGKLLSPQAVLEQLKYRYERELNKAQRPALRRICEGDSCAGRPMVLCVTAIISVGTMPAPDTSGPASGRGDRRDAGKGMERGRKRGRDSDGEEEGEGERGSGGSQPGSDSEGGNERSDKSPRIPVAVVEVTDGWYCIKAQLDPVLTARLSEAKIFPGQKLKVWGAMLHGCAGGVPPLEAYNSALLILHANGTQRVAWHTRLGFCAPQECAPLALNRIREQGGMVPLVALGVVRVYPLIYWEKGRDGAKGVMRSERAEARAASEFQKRRDRCAEEAAHAFEREMEKAQVRSRRRRSSHSRGRGRGRGAGGGRGAGRGGILGVGCGVGEWEGVEEMSVEDRELREREIQRQQEEVRAEAEAAVKEALEEAECEQREVTPLLRVRVAGLSSALEGDNQGAGPVCEAILSIWRPSEDQLVGIQEGQRYLVSNVQPYIRSQGGSMDQDWAVTVRLTTSRASVWKKLAPASPLRFDFTPRQGIHLESYPMLPAGREFDAVGVVVDLHAPQESGPWSTVQWAFLAQPEPAALGAGVPALGTRVAVLGAGMAAPEAEAEAEARGLHAGPGTRGPTGLASPGIGAGAAGQGEGAEREPLPGLLGKAEAQAVYPLAWKVLAVAVTAPTASFVALERGLVGSIVSWRNLKPAMGGVRRQAPCLDMECEGVAEWEVVGVAEAADDTAVTVSETQLASSGTAFERAQAEALGRWLRAHPEMMAALRALGKG